MKIIALKIVKIFVGGLRAIKGTRIVVTLAYPLPMQEEEVEDFWKSRVSWPTSDV